MVRQYPLNRWVSGTYKRSCDQCDRDMLRSEMRKQWDGLVVCPKCFDPRHPSTRPRKTVVEKAVQID